MSNMRADINLVESEETWERIARAIAAFTTTCHDVDPTELVLTVRSLSRPLISAINSERGRLSGVAIDLVAVLASCLGVAFDPLLPHFFPVLLVLSGRTSKVTVSRARTCVLAIIETTQLPAILSHLAQFVTDKSVSLRQTVVESTLACMNCFNPPDLEKDVRAKEIEVILRVTARDANADVRKVSRKIFEAYKVLLPSRLDSFTAPLTPTTRKYLDIQLKQPHLKATQLSSSTSAARAPSSRRPPTHTRSASTPNIPPVAGTSKGNDERPSRAPKAEMAPPKLTQPSAQAVRPAAVVERTRVVSMSAAARPAISSTKLGAPERALPNPTSNHPTHRPQLTNEVQRPIQISGARRVPVADVQIKLDADKPTRARPRIDNSVSTPAIRLASAPVAKSSASRAAPVPSKDERHPKASANEKSREPTKQRSLMQPTLSQISRAKTIERRVPTISRTAVRKVPAVVNPKKSATGSSTQSTTSSVNVPQTADAASIAVKDDKEDQREADAPSTPERTQSKVPDAREQEATVTESLPIPLEAPTTPATPKVVTNSTATSSKTPISELLLSIERGFVFTPGAPLSPPESYLPQAPTNLAIPFPLRTMWSGSEEDMEESGDAKNKACGILESRRALEDVVINK